MTYTYGATNTAIAHLSKHVAMLTERIKLDEEDMAEMRKAIGLNPQTESMRRIAEQWRREDPLRYEIARAAAYREKYYPHETPAMRSQRLEEVSRELNRNRPKFPMNNQIGA